MLLKKIFQKKSITFAKKMRCNEKTIANFLCFRVKHAKRDKNPIKIGTYTLTK